MKLYKTIAIAKDGVGDDRFTWQASGDAASKARTAAKSAGFKATSEVVEIPTNKEGLLAWLNENVKS